MKHTLKCALLLVLIAALSFPTLATAQSTSGISEGAAVLFKRVNTKLSDADKNAVFKSFGYRLSKNKKSFLSPTDKEGVGPFGVTVYALDLNGDGTEEIVIEYSSGSGGAGMSDISTAVFIKSTVKGYAKACDVDGFIEILPTNNQGYPDLVVGGPGMSFPVLRWNGKNYKQFRQISNSALEKTKRKSVEDASAGR